MKLLDFASWDEPIGGFVVDILKFKNKSVIQFGRDELVIGKTPSLMIQIGGSELFYASLSLGDYVYYKSIWARHYQD